MTRWLWLVDVAALAPPPPPSGVPLPRSAGEDYKRINPPPFTGEVAAKPTEGAGAPRRSLAVLAALALAACGHSPPTRFFTLDPVAPSAPTAAYAGPPLRLDAVHIPPAWNRPELVRTVGANEIAVEDFAQWAAPLGETARRALTQDLAARLPAKAVIYPDAPKPAGAAGLVVDVLAFTDDGATGTLDASWTLIPGQAAPGGATGARAHPLRVTAAAVGTGAAARVALLSRLLAAMADQIAVAMAAGSP